MNVPVAARIPLVVVGASEETLRRSDAASALVSRLGRIESVAPAQAVPAGSAQFVIGEATWALPLAGIIDITAEQGRLGKEIGKLDGEIAGIDKKLANPQFVAKAPGEEIEEKRQRREDAVGRRGKLESALARLP
jgi:valyl-tRNA synthetase